MRGITSEQLFDALGVRLDGAAAAEQPMIINWEFPDLSEHWLLRVQHGALSALPGGPTPQADVSVRLDRETLDLILLKERDALVELQAGRITLNGDGEKLGIFFGLLSAPDPGFAIVTP